MLAGIQDGLHLIHGQHPRQLAGRLHRDGPAGLRLALADMVKERAPAAPPAATWLPRGQQLAEVDPVPRLIGVERRQR